MTISVPESQFTSRETATKKLPVVVYIHGGGRPVRTDHSVSPCKINETHSRGFNGFIDGFGGDADNITAFAESAGSTFLVYHICGSSTRLFDRAILQSGLIFWECSVRDQGDGVSDNVEAIQH